GGVTIPLGDGSAHFSAAPGSPIQADPGALAVIASDLNEDGKLDLVLAENAVKDEVTILLGNGNGGFSQAPGSPLPVVLNPAALELADLNRDGHPDLVVPGNSGSI